MSPGGFAAKSHPEAEERVQNYSPSLKREPGQLASRARGIISGHRDALTELAGILADQKLPTSSLLTALSALAEAAAALRGDGR